jgi:hypothetical protein
MRSIETTRLPPPISTPVQLVLPVTPVVAATTPVIPVQPVQLQTPEAKTQTQPETAESALPDHTQEEIQLLDAIYKAAVHAANLGREERTLAGKLKALQDELDAARSLKKSLIEQLPDALLKLRDGIEAAVTAVTGEPSQDTQVDNSWRSRPTSSILDGISKFGPKKMKETCEKYPTLGALNDARAQAAMSHTHLAELLPKGIGKPTSDIITERLIDVELGKWKFSDEVKHSGGPIPKTVASDDQDGQTDEQPEVVPVAHEAWIAETVKHLAALDSEDAFNNKGDEDIWLAGFDAFAGQQEPEDCPTSLDESNKTNWLRGFLAAKELSNEETNKQDEFQLQG